MKILLLANHLPDQRQSINRFAQILETGLTELGHQVRLIRSQPCIGRLQLSLKGLGKWLSYIDKYLLFAHILPQELSWPDIPCGCPVITSKRPPMTEVGGEAAIYINPTNPEEAAETIAACLPILKFLKQKAIFNAQYCTADKMIASDLELYQTAIFQKNSGRVDYIKCFYLKNDSQ
ncbi:hypothetical protein MTo_04092 [Microcystis aeruginosa NIES-1211]|jgi:hypothetical protein|uniref:Glycosyltransferase subfamily 4-like N-terminal domain-containing protein n=1 Tax=Microcystis aeruginosa NIES-2519 TaxID=2303981 RepID=A0A5A5R271_MICAE|nr:MULTISPECIES: hypothetical protein [Microcystis]AVQ71090.1 hypothetical protein B5D77_06955 [Microcystis sp. MC19]CCI32195.1 hypothetical protein MICAI_240004 [Microcystis sp. T1-4]GBL16767.1 hypothetical protein MTo_04092 [Microcystis aeruginosa NIES-1211]GCA68535.1 hypothetical protein MiYa_00049 [Microcystis aeruginosa NIES-2519]GCA83575.1 hypothetical protein MiHa_01540 [Microcystis aeruginosa NIES-2522]